jgi:23S rRNA (guanosine2251-2'-O)-methyltransferase
VTNLPTYLQALKERGVWAYGSAGDGDVSPRDVDWDREVVLVIGAEGHGMRRLVRERCDEVLQVRLRGRVASLNASVAAGILLHEIVTGRERIAAGHGS